MSNISKEYSKKYDNLSDHINNKINDLLEKKSNNYRKSILILSGGGMKGIAHIGALKALKDNNMLQHINTIGCASVGAIVASMHILGYTPDEMYDFIELFDMKKVRSCNVDSFFENFGVDDGKKFNIFLEKIFEAKNVSKDITFKELYAMKKIKFIMTTVCLNDKQVYYLSHTSFPNLSVIYGIRMTTCVPLWFSPIKYNNKLFVDGGCIDNYPIQLFSNNLNSVIGVYLCEHNDIIENIENPEDFITNLIKCFKESITCNSVKGYEKYTVRILLPQITLIELNLTNIMKKKLYDCGYIAMNNYIERHL